MLPFFRKIRMRLAADNQFLKYSRYAVGEIVLVVIGILIALYINNWNERRKEDERFKLIIEQIYNEVDIERAWLTSNSLAAQSQIDLIDSIMISPQKIPDDILPYAVFYVDMGINLKKYLGGSSDFMTSLEYDYEDVEKLKVAKQIQLFVDNFEWDPDNKKSVLEPLLNEKGLPTPFLIPKFSEFGDFASVDKTFFTRTQQDTLRSILNSTPFQTALMSLRSSRLKTLELYLKNRLIQVNSLMSIIKNYDPSVRLLYRDIGIVGSALEKGWEETVLMSRTHPDKSIWTIDIELEDGEVRFRSGDSWTQNWGGNGFPTGDAIYSWESILVNKGRYRITLDLEERMYNFQKISN